MTQFSWLYGGIFIVIGTTLHFIGFCALFEAMALDICTNLSDLSDTISDGNQTFSATNRIELNQRLYKIIKFHTEALRFIFSKIFTFLKHFQSLMNIIDF